MVYAAAGNMTIRAGLAEEISRNGNITRWFYDSSRSGLPCAVEDWNRGEAENNNAKPVRSASGVYGLLGNATRYKYDRYGHQIAVHREEGISTYISYNPAWPTGQSEGCAGA